jgi:tetratricopeptide (TPR) repeat protein
MLQESTNMHLFTRSLTVLAFCAAALAQMGNSDGLSGNGLSENSMFPRGAGTVSPRPLAPDERGDIYMARKMYREAIDMYSLLPATSATRWNKTGIAYHQLLDYRAAKESYQHAVKINPSLGEALNNLGTISFAEKRYRNAIKQYKKALRILPTSASVYSNLGTAYFVRKDYNRASESYSEAISLDPDVFDNHNSFGVLLQQHSVEDRAMLHYYLAKMYAKQGMNQRALQCIRKSLEEGFSERRKFLEDAEFGGLRNTVEFKEVLASAPRVL